MSWNWSARLQDAINPKVSPFTGMVLATVAPVHIAEPSANCRAALMTLPLTTRADALAAVALLESNSEDHELAARLLKGLRVYLSAT